MIHLKGRHFAPVLGLLLGACMTDMPEKPGLDSASKGPEGAESSETGLNALPPGGEWIHGYWRGEAIYYYRHQGVNYFETDIIIPDNEIKLTMALSKESAAGLNDHYWPRTEIPYVIDPSASAFTTYINSAIDHWKTRTPVLYIPRTTQTDYVRFMGSTVNNSSVGRIGGQQIINLVSTSMGTVAHEMGHAIGLWHEQSRADRGNFIEINWSNIKPAMTHNFDTEGGFVLDGFDYGSIMLYPSFISDAAFVYDPNVWVMRKISDQSTWSANRTALSNGDIRGAGRMYPGTAPIYLATNNDLIGGVIYGLMPGISRFQVDGNRILALTADGTLFGKDGLHGSWLNLLSGVQKFWFSGDYIAALLPNGDLYGKVGISGTWKRIRIAVKDVRVEGSRFVALATDNYLYGMDGRDGTWLPLLPNVKEFHLAGNRIGALSTDGTLYGKDGLSGTWLNLRSSVSAFSIVGNRIAAKTTDGTLWATDGLNINFLNLISGVSTFQLEGNRIGALLTNGTLMAKDGISGTWATEIGGASGFYLSGDAITVKLGNNMQSKIGLSGYWHYYAGNLSQFEQI
jgi:hypothetical protein